MRAAATVSRGGGDPQAEEEARRPSVHTRDEPESQCRHQKMVQGGEDQEDGDIPHLPAHFLCPTPHQGRAHIHRAATHGAFRHRDDKHLRRPAEQDQGQGRVQASRHPGQDGDVSGARQET